MVIPIYHSYYYYREKCLQSRSLYSISFRWTQAGRRTTKVFAKAGLDIVAIGCVQALAAVPAEEFQFGF